MKSIGLPAESCLYSLRFIFVKLSSCGLPQGEDVNLKSVKIKLDVDYDNIHGGLAVDVGDIYSGEIMFWSGSCIMRFLLFLF